MSDGITLFSGYSQGENRTTNYCLLVLKMLYEEDPKLFAETLGALVGEVHGGLVGVSFRQQSRRGSGIPDGLIVQEAFHVHIETKNFDWFYDAQLERHLDDLMKEPGSRILVALSNFERNAEARFASIRKLCQEKYGGRVTFAAVGFKDFLDAIPRDRLPKSLSDMVDDFASSLDGTGLLPRWQYLLDVVNCSAWPEEVVEHRAYICPAKGGSYNHARARYFGVYANKTVGSVASIEAVVDVDDQGEVALLWNNVDASLPALAERATALRKQLRADHEGSLRVFLLGGMHETDLRKVSSGGMQYSKRYFDVEKYGASGAAELARALRGETWE